MSNLAGAAILLVALLMSFSAAEALATDPPDNAYGLRAADVFRCGEGTVTITATWDESSSDISENIRWYEQPFYGEHIHTGATFETPFLELSKTYFIDYIFTDGSGQEECGICDRIAVRANISYEVIENRISYQGNFFCKTEGTYEPTVTGISGGTFSAVQVGGGTASLTIDAQTGVINPETSDIAEFEISYTPPTVPGCPTTPATWMVTITEQPVGTSISYPIDRSYCASEGAGTVAVIFAEGYYKPDNAFFSSTPSGLSLISSSGTIDLSDSQTGVYTITYTVPGGGGCAPIFATTTVKIEQLPQATISYASPFCGDLDEAQLPSITGNINGTFSELTGLTIDPSTGAITPGSSTAGVYTVTYTIPESTICPVVIVETSVEVLPALEATISATVTSVFAEIDPDVVVTFEGTTGDAPHNFFYRIGDDTSPLLEITSDAVGVATVTQLTTVPGTYTYTLVSVTDNNDCSAEVIDQSVVITVNPTPVAEFSYPNTPYCQDSGIATPTFEGQVGDFTYSPNTATLTFADNGKINLAESDPGTYEVTNTVEGNVSHTTEITITRAQIATFSYGDDPYCPSGTATPTLTDIGVFSADDIAVIFADDEGTIDLETTFPGTYTITHTIQAGGGCEERVATAQITILATPNFTGNRYYEICSGEDTNIQLTSDMDGTQFTWTVGTISPSNSITGASDCVSSCGTSIIQTLTNSSNSVDATIEYIVTPTNTNGGDCADGPVATIVLVVRAMPELSNLPEETPTVCSGELFEYVPESDHPNVTVEWNRPSITGISDNGNSDSQTGVGSISETLVNTNNDPVIVTYTYTLQTGVTVGEIVCTNTQDIGVIVYPEVTMEEPDDIIICDGGTVSVSFTSLLTGGNVTYSWTNSEPGIGLEASGTGDIAAFTASNTTSSEIIATIEVTPEYTPEGEEAVVCEGAPVSFTMTIQPRPATPTTIYGDDNTRVVSYTGTEFTVTATTTTSGATIKWYIDNVSTTVTTAPTETATGTYTAWAEAEIESTGCVSPERIQVTLEIVAIVVDGKGYNTLQDAFDAIEDGTHSGEVNVYIYADPGDTDTATLDMNKVGEGTSVNIIAKSDIQIKQGVVIDNSN